jgi:hypothetical protein
MNMPTLLECKKYYTDLNEGCGKIIEISFISPAAEQYFRRHNFSSDLEKWIRLQSDRHEVEVLKSSLNEYQYSLLAVAQGRYRQSFMALRLSFELALASIYFSANEFDFRLWKQGVHDINWQKLINPDNGVLSRNFIKAFNPAMAEDAPQYRVIAEKVYRECSEYVHGNAHTYKNLSDKVEFIEDVFSDWCIKAENIALCIIFALSARYLLFSSKETRKKVEPIIMDILGHLDAIRNLYSE